MEVYSLKGYNMRIIAHSAGDEGKMLPANIKSENNLMDHEMKPADLEDNIRSLLRLTPL